MKFKVIKKSKKTRARLGILETEHGVVETPTFVPVATQAVIRSLDCEEVKQTKSQILICNTFHLHCHPGEEIIKYSGGLHQFMNWDGPLMTDSGGFQVFSLGFGSDLGVGKILKFFPGESKNVDINSKPKNLKITHDGVFFHSLTDGKEMFLGPKESISIQEKIGADIIFAFDECTPPLVTYDYAKAALSRTHRWAKICLVSLKTKQAMFGIVQGSRFKDLREESALFMNNQGFSGFGIGGDLGASKKTTKDILDWTIPYLLENKPRHLLGIGYPEDIEEIVKKGIDLFDCTVPTHYARRGIAYTTKGRLDLNKKEYLNDLKPIDSQCTCHACQNYKRNYLCHLLRAKEFLANKLLTYHNLFYFNQFVANIRKKIKEGKI